MRNLKKVVALIAVFAMMVSTVAFAATFTDVAEGHDYFEAIEMLSKLEILTGYEDGAFRPEDTITRAEVATVISRIQGITNAAQAGTEFVDVPQTHWASGYVAQAAGQGIVNGYGDGTFGPEDPVLYEQAIKMLVETLGYAPFVADNGGYYAGHLTAASRYGVLDGVVGGAVGTPATRGQVAQMVYNAIDTPIMDRYTYGKDAEYVVYDGKNGRDYMTLLTRDLGVKKFTGLLVESEISTYADGKAIDTEEPAELAIDVLVDDAYANYDMDDITGYGYDSYAGDVVEARVLAGEESAVDLIGMNVNVLVKKVKNSTDYEVVSIAPASTNKVVEFTIDQFAYGVDADDEVYYYQNGAKKATAVALDPASLAVFYNNVWESTVKPFEDKSVEETALVTKDSTYSGKVTLIDNDSDKYYDVVRIEVAATAVVDEVEEDGTIVFFNEPANSLGDSIQLVFDEEETEQIINLTKDGAAIEYTELAKWDVLSVIYNAEAEYYDVEVLASTAVEGEVTQKTVSDTSAEGYKFRIAGNSYDVAEGCYMGDKIDIGAAGMFYIDAYGKIVAYDKTGSKTVSDNYAFVMGAADVENSFGETTINIQILDKTGALQRGELAEKVTIKNSAVATGGRNDLYDIATDLDKEELADLADELTNAFITFDVNAKGQIDKIEFPYADPDDGFYLSYDGTAGMSYDEEDRELGGFDLADDTILFYINAKGEGSMFDEGAVASTTKSTVGAVAALATNSAIKCMVYDAEEDKVPGAVVIFDQNAGISPSTNVAVIDEVGSAYVDGEEVVSVSYFMNGELLNAVTYEELSNADDVAAADQGDIWKFSVTEGVITAAEELVTYDRYTKVVEREVNGETVEVIVESLVAGEAEGAAATFGTAFSTRGDEAIYAGAVVDYKSSNKKFVLGNGDKFNATSETNVYVFDPSLRKNKLSVGTAGNVTVNKKLLEDRDGKAIDFKSDDYTDLPGTEDALGMLDYAVAYEYDGDVLDIVIYKAYDFGRFSFVAAL